MPRSSLQEIRTIRKIYKELLLLSNFEKGKEYLKKVVIKYTDSYGDLSSKEIENKIDYPLRIVRSVSGIIGMGTVSITALILFELLKDKKITLNEVKKGYSSDIYKVCEGLVLTGKIDFENLGEQVSLFIDLLLNLSKDIRVVLCLLAESLVNVKNPNLFDSSEEYKNSVQKSYFLFAPIAHKLGFYTISGEIENAYLKISKSDIFNDIKSRIENVRQDADRIIPDFLKPVEKELHQRGIKYITKWRTKSVYSIYKKMQVQHVPVEKVFDLLAIRIIITGQKTDEKGDCWETYSVVTNLYEPKPDRFRDWITRPKITGYESLHTTVREPSGYWIEVQIRSKRMDEIAENGVATHFKYKGKVGENEIENWLNHISHALGQDSNKTESTTQKRSIKAQKIYCFTPKGNLIRLSEGSTLLDFAYHIHTDVGEHCSGGIVNGKNVPLKFKLNNGDQVEIKTLKSQTPRLDWLKFVKSSRAKSKIKRFLVEKDLKDANIGRDSFLRKLRNWKINYNDALVSDLIKKFELKNSLELYSAIATGLIQFEQVKNYLLKDDEAGNKIHPAKVADSSDRTTNAVTDDLLIIENEISGVNYRLAKCCKPIKGDFITGFITIGKGISIHKANCSNLGYLMSKYPYRKLPAKWSESSSNTNFLTTIRIEGTDKMGLLNTLTEIISKEMEIYIHHVKISSEEQKFVGVFNINIKNTNQLHHLIARIQNVKGVESIRRVR